MDLQIQIFSKKKFIESPEVPIRFVVVECDALGTAEVGQDLHDSHGGSLLFSAWEQDIPAVGM